MTQTDNSPAQSHALSRPARVAWLLLIIATLYICYFHNLGAIGLVGPDEPRYAWIARAMTETGDWVTPRLYGQPWFEKPVLYYWGAALSFKLFGVSEAAARLPSAVAALLATLALAWLALRLYSAETARWLLLLLPTTVGMIGFSHAAATDMPFAAMLTIAMVCAAVVLGLTNSANTPILPRTPWLALLLLGFFLGLAVLAKGPAAIILSGSAVLLWGIFTKRWRDAFRCLHPVAIASFCATALPWYVLCARRNPDFFRIFIIEHNFKRYLTPEFQHIQPFWFYIPILLLAIFPWTVLLFPTSTQILAAYRNRGTELDHVRFFLCWPAFTFFFFTISKSKLPGYILPAVPPLALLLARTVSKAVETKSPRWPIFALAGSLIALGVTFAVISNRLPAYTDIRPAPLVMEIAIIAVLGGAAAIAVLGLLQRNRAVLFSLIVTVLLLVIATDRYLRKIDSGLTAHPALAQAALLWPEFRVDGAATWRLNRSLYYQLNFYAHAELPEWKPGEPKPAWLFVESRFERQARDQGFTCRDYLIFPALTVCKGSASAGGLEVLGGADRFAVGAGGKPR